MTTAPPPLPPTAAEAVFRQALRDMFVLLGALTVVGVVVGYLIDGMAGVWGALIGVFVALIFSGTTVVSVWRTSRSNPTTMLAVLMGAWLGKLSWSSSCSPRSATSTSTTRRFWPSSSWSE